MTFLVVGGCILESVYGQSTFQFRNFAVEYGIDAPILDAAGLPLEGPRYLAALYGGPSEDSLTPAIHLGSPVYSPFFSGVGAGYFEQSEVEVATVPPGGNAWLRVHAWDTTLGTTYDDVKAQGIGGYGESNFLFLRGGTELELPKPLIGLESFGLRAVIPEPNAALLLLLGVPWLVWRCGKRSRS